MSEKTSNRENRDFVQFYRRNMDIISKMNKENPRALDLFMFLTKHMDNRNALIVSMKALQEILGCGRTTISKSVRYLKENGYICVLKSGTSNVYVVNPEIAWTSYDNQKQYCKFQSNVILSSTENAEYLHNRNAFQKIKSVNNGFMEEVSERQRTYEKQLGIYREALI